MKTMDSKAILDLPMKVNDANAATIREYLVALTHEIWREGEGFSGKRPFGNSSWEHEVYRTLAEAGVIDSTTDDDGYVEYTQEEQRRADGLILEAIDSMEVREVPGELIQPWTPPGLTTSQLIRLDAARLLLTEWSGMCSTRTGDDSGTVKDFASDVLYLAAAIETGAEALPSPDATGVAEGEPDPTRSVE